MTDFNKKDFLEKQSLTVQTLVFDKDKFTEAQAIKWVQDHDFKFSKIDEKEDSFRLRQRNPDLFQDGSFRTIEIAEGITTVLGKVKEEKISKGFFDYIKNLVKPEVFRKIQKYSGEEQVIDCGKDKLKICKISKESDLNQFSKVFKAHDDKQIALCIVIEPLTKVTPSGDNHGDSMTIEEVEKTAHSFAMNGMKIDFRHNGRAIEDVFVVESGIHRGPDFEFKNVHNKSEIMKTGTWYIGIYAKNKQIWKSLKCGELGGVSPGGFGKRRAL